MAPWKCILAPVDFSDRSLRAAEHAVALARRFDARLIIAHVIDRPPYKGTEWESFYHQHGEVISVTQLNSGPLANLREFTGKVALGIPAEQLLLKGDPAREIEKLAQQEHVDLIVMPTHGYGGFRRFLLGSVTAKILHDVSCAVFTGAHLGEIPPFGTQPYQRIGCAIDLGDHSEELLRGAGEFARSWNARLVVIHATPFVDVIFDSAHVVTADWRDMVVRAARDKAGHLLQKLGCEAELVFGNGHPVHFVTAIAAEQKLDALVIGRGNAKQRSSRLPAHAYGIIREAPCAVISLT